MNTATPVEVTIVRHIVRTAHANNGNMDNPTFEYLYITPDKSSFSKLSKAKESVREATPNAKFVITNSPRTTEEHSRYPLANAPK